MHVDALMRKKAIHTNNVIYDTFMRSPNIPHQSLFLPEETHLGDSLIHLYTVVGACARRLR